MEAVCTVAPTMHMRCERARAGSQDRMLVMGKSEWEREVHIFDAGVVLVSEGVVSLPHVGGTKGPLRTQMEQLQTQPFRKGTILAWLQHVSDHVPSLTSAQGAGGKRETMCVEISCSDTVVVYKSRAIIEGQMNGESPKLFGMLSSLQRHTCARNWGSKSSLLCNLYQDRAD